MIQADPFRGREDLFFFNGHCYKTKFKMSRGWSIFDSSGIVVSEKHNPEVWQEFRDKHQPAETKSELFPQ
jgi:hypothetical protein